MGGLCAVLLRLVSCTRRKFAGIGLWFTVACWLIVLAFGVCGCGCCYVCFVVYLYSVIVGVCVRLLLVVVVGVFDYCLFCVCLL